MYALSEKRKSRIMSRLSKDEWRTTAKVGIHDRDVLNYLAKEGIIERKVDRDRSKISPYRRGEHAKDPEKMHDFKVFYKLKD